MRNAPKDTLTNAISLKIEVRVRDFDEEKRRQNLFQAEVQKIADLPNKAYAVANGELRRRIGLEEVWITEEKNFGVLRHADWLFALENPFKTLEEIGRRLRAYDLLGAQTQDKTTVKLEQLIREARKDIECGDVLVDQIASAGQFFKSDQPARLAEWSRYGLDPQVGRISWNGTELRVADDQNDAVALSLRPDWSSVDFRWPGAQ